MTPYKGRGEVNPYRGAEPATQQRNYERCWDEGHAVGRAEGERAAESRAQAVCDRQRENYEDARSTDLDLPRGAQLKALRNAVVPAQAAAAWEMLA